MLAPHWLDSIFTDNITDWETNLLNHPQFKKAMVTAAKAYTTQKAAIEKSQSEGNLLCGGSPSQSARGNFLAEIQNNGY